MGPSTAWAGQPCTLCPVLRAACIPATVGQCGPPGGCAGTGAVRATLLSQRCAAARQLTPPLGAQIQPCPIKTTHPWEQCCYAHPHENARRRDPRKYRYIAEPCPDYKRGICLLARPPGRANSTALCPAWWCTPFDTFAARVREVTSCVAAARRSISAQDAGEVSGGLRGARATAQGNQCPYAHGVYERNLHPSKYRTQLCTEGERCSRRVCFFAHSHQQLRMPVGAWSLEEAVRAWPPGPRAAVPRLCTSMSAGWAAGGSCRKPCVAALPCVSSQMFNHARAATAAHVQVSGGGACPGICG